MVSELKYPPMCFPFDYGDQLVAYGNYVRKFKHVNDTFLLSNFVLPQIGAVPLCGSSSGCTDEATKKNQYGLCRIEKRMGDSNELVQLWPRGTVDYRFAGWPAGSKRTRSLLL